VAATAERTTIATTGLTKRYDDIVALEEVSLELADDAIGLLGANGAGKSTLMRALLGLVEPDAGTARLLGIDAAARGLELRRRIGYMPEHECLPSWMTARDLVVHLGELRGLPRRIAVLRTSEVLFQVGLEEERLRLIGTFSTGMRQRVKLAQALVHSPELLLLDEPLNGLDPVQRRHVVELIRRLGAEGRTVLVSSHVLHEVERMAPRVVVLVNGRLVAEGETGAIRDLIRDRPRTLRIAAGGAAQALARELVGEGLASGVRIDNGALVVETGDMDALGRRLMPLARDLSATVDRVEPLGDDLESVYTYLTDHARGRGR